MKIKILCDSFFFYLVLFISLHNNKRYTLFHVLVLSTLFFFVFLFFKKCIILGRLNHFDCEIEPQIRNNQDFVGSLAAAAMFSFIFLSC